MSKSLDNILFGSLSNEYCRYFYYLSVIGFVLLVFITISGLYIGITKRKGSDFYFYTILIALGYLIFYFQNRLLYSMCINSI